MSEKYRWVLMTLAVVVSLTASLLSAQPDQITLDHREAFGKKQRPPVVFPHLQHIEKGLACLDCHHRYEQGENVLDEGELEEGKAEIRCSACHGLKAGTRLREAFHRQCLRCHAKAEKEGKGTGPRLCEECHPWKSQGAGK